MPILYPMQSFGPFSLGLGLTFEMLHQRYGFDFGERFHRDAAHRIDVTKQLDRAVWDDFRAIGLGYENPFPRISIEPYGHRFMPAMYGAPCAFAPGGEPWAQAAPLSAEQIDALEPWTRERFEASEPVRRVFELTREARRLAEADGAGAARQSDYSLHQRAMSSMQNLGSVVNTGFSVQGDGLFLQYLTEPEAVKKLYANITELMLVAIESFSDFDGQTPAELFVGNCSVSMLSPAQYAEFNEPCDRRIMELARARGVRFLMHQDSDVTPHLPRYAAFDYLHGIDFGQDTDFEAAVRLMPHVAANCILFPAWVRATSADAMREELRRLMRIGQGFASFSFSLWEVDAQLAEGKIFEFHEAFRQAAEDCLAASK